MSVGIVLLALAPPAAASGGADIANNLFTDLGPLIALFGEQVSKQFLSQSLGLADSLLFAMAPLGIITGVVSAIRLSGYTWLRAIAGRVTETRGAAGLELTSATSADICELWDGQSVVRILGTPTILTVVYVDPEGPLLSEEESPSWNHEELEPLAADKSNEEMNDVDDRVIDFEEAQRRRWFTSRSYENRRKKRINRLQGSLWEQSEDAVPPRNKDIQQRPIPIPPIPPNIALNVRRRPPRSLVQFSASVAVILQVLVLVTGGIFNFDKSIVHSSYRTSYGFPLLTTGTFLVCSGLFLCASMVNMSSKKEYWKARADELGNPLVKLVWLQKRQIVNDQSFPSFAIRPLQLELLVSYADEDFVHIHHQRVLYGVVLSLVGFIIQFVGFRSIHWAASIAQLVAMVGATLIRVFVQMPFSEAADCRELDTKFELDWMVFEIHRVERWWPRVPPLEFRSMASRDAKSQTELIHKSRRKLGDMAQNIGWEPTYGEDAMVIKGTIESFMDVLWSYPDGLTRQGLSLHEFKCYFCMNSKTGLGKADFKNTFHITIKREKHTGGWTSWTADLGEIEAFLSLWLYQVRLDNATSAKEAKEEEDEDEDHVVDQFIWAVAPLSAISCLDFDYWIRRSNYPFRIESQDVASKFIHFEGLRGLRSPQCENISGSSRTFGPKQPPFLLAMMTYATLPRICGRYLLAGVVRQVLQYLSSLQGNTTFNGGTTPINSDSTAYKNTMIDSLAGAAVRTDLLTFQDALAVIIPALRERGLLPSWPEENYDMSGSTPGSTQGSMYTHLRTAGAMRRVGRWHVARIVLEHAAQLGGVENKRDGLIERLKECTGVQERYIDSLAHKKDGGGRSSGSDPVGEDNDNEGLQNELQINLQAFLNSEDRTHGSGTITQGEHIDSISASLEHDLEAQQNTIVCDPDASNNALEETDQDPGQDSLVATHLSRLNYLLDEQHPCRLELFLSYRPSRNTLRNLLREAIDRGYYLPTLLIILETLNDPHLKKLRSELKSLLYLPTQNQNNDLLKLLLFYAQRPIVIVEEDRNPLFDAAKTGNIEAIKLMLAAGISAESRGNDGSTVLQTAAGEGQLELVKTLIEVGAEIDGAVAPGKSPALSAAVYGGDIEVVDLLLKKGADPNPPYRPCGTPLQVAARTSLEMVRRLVDAGADVNYPAPPRGLTALQAAVMANKPNIVQYLLQRGADVRSTGSNHRTGIQMAIKAGHTAVADVLYAAGSAVPASLVTAPVDTPELLRDRSIPGRHTPLSSLDTPRPRAGPSRHSPSHSLESMDSQSPSDLPSFLRWTPFQLAAKEGNEVRLASLLATDDANAPATLLKGRTALQAAAEEGHDAIVAMLLSVSDVNAQRAEIGGITALEAASGAGHLAVVRRLVVAGADVNCPAGAEGGTALQMACQGGHVEIVRFLLEAGGNVEAGTAEIGGLKAVEAARKGGWVDVLALLEDHVGHGVSG